MTLIFLSQTTTSRSSEALAAFCSDTRMVSIRVDISFDLSPERRTQGNVWVDYRYPVPEGRHLVQTRASQTYIGDDADALGRLASDMFHTLLSEDQ